MLLTKLSALFLANSLPPPLSRPSRLAITFSWTSCLLMPYIDDTDSIPYLTLSILLNFLTCFWLILINYVVGCLAVFCSCFSLFLFLRQIWFLINRIVNYHNKHTQQNNQCIKITVSPLFSWFRWTVIANRYFVWLLRLGNFFSMNFFFFFFSLPPTLSLSAAVVSKNYTLSHYTHFRRFTKRKERHIIITARFLLWRSL